MSAYLVNKDTIDRILTTLNLELSQNRMLQIKMEEMTGVSYEFTDWKDKLGTIMLNMNQMALGARYTDKMIVHTYKYQPLFALSTVQALKSLQCFTYQCAEGTIPSTNLYKFFDQVLERQLAFKIIYAMPQYDQADWA